jgi:hypothetical protein
MKSVAGQSHSTLRSLGAALEEAMGKFNPDRTSLPLPQRSFGATIGRMGVQTYRQVSTEPIPTGDVTVRMLFESDQPVAGSGGRVTSWANDRRIGEGDNR